MKCDLTLHKFYYVPYMDNLVVNSTCLFDVTRIVRSYLLHYGYEDTLNSFDVASKNTVPPISIAQENGFNDQKDMYALSQRKTLRQV